MSELRHDDTTLSTERDHLDHAHAALAAMRSQTEDIGDVGADELTSFSLGKVRAARLATLAIDRSVPLFFGRIDTSGPADERFYIGRRHVRENAGSEPLVIDWRTPVARGFYRATAADPMGLRLRRRFGYSRGELTSYEDEPLDRPGPADPSGDSALLREEIERPRAGPMRDIVATIQPDQDEIVRADLDRSICVQGAPGTGKTAVGLHRAAFLLYTYRERLHRSGVLVVGPNATFLRYIGQVLPALGEIEVEQRTVDELAARVPVRAQDDPEVARLKGDRRMAEVLRRALYGPLTPPTEPVTVMIGSRRHRVAPARIARWMAELADADIPYGAARERLTALVVQRIRRQIEAAGGAPGDREMARIGRSAQVRTVVDAAWPATDAATLVAGLLSDPGIMAPAAEGVLDADEQRALLWDRPRSARTARWSAGDAVLVDEAAGLVDREPGYGHVVVDEAQDLSPMQCRAVARRCPTGSFTVLGDLAQGTGAWATAGWPQILTDLGRPDVELTELTRGYRVPGEVLDLANRLLPHVAPGLAPATSVRRGGGALAVCSAADLLPEVIRQARAALAGEGSIGVICADSAASELRAALAGAGLECGELDEDTRLSVIPATLAKGLEFDQVILVEPAEIVRSERYGLRRLYVALTRAVSRLVILHREPLPDALIAA